MVGMDHDSVLRVVRGAHKAGMANRSVGRSMVVLLACAVEVVSA